MLIKPSVQPLQRGNDHFAPRCDSIQQARDDAENTQRSQSSRQSKTRSFLICSAIAIKYTFDSFFLSQHFKHKRRKKTVSKFFT